MRMSLVTVLVFFLVGTVFAVPVTNNDLGFTKFDKRVNNGDATYYYQGGAFGSCGKQNDDSAMIVALSTTYCQSFDSPNCGKKIKITAVNGPTPGASVVATVADTCMGCKPQDVDCSLAVFSGLCNGDYNIGRFQIIWEWVSE